jgi:hypothetical protein
MPTVIDSLIVTLGLDSKDVDAKAPGVRRKLGDFEKDADKAAKSTQAFGKELKDVSAKLGSFLAVIGGTVAVRAFVKDTIDTNTQLYFLSRNLEMNTQKLFAWGAAAQEIGGNKGSIQGFMQTIAGMPGELLLGRMPQLLPLFARMGINFREPIDQIMVDLSKRFAGMDRKVAFSFGMASGIPEDVMNLILQEPGAVQGALDRIKEFGPTGKEAAQAVELKRRFTDLELLIVKIGYDLLSRVTPALEKFLDILLKIGAWAQRHGEIVAIVAGLAAALAGVAGLAGALGAVSMAWNALMAGISAALPVLAVVGIVAALGVAIASLWDDYKVWSEGGNSLFDWTEFEKNVHKAGEAFDWLGDKIEKATDAFKKWLSAHGVNLPDNAVGNAAAWYWNNATLPGILGAKVNTKAGKAIEGKSSLTSKDVEDYFIGRGYSKEFAAAMAASMQGESGGNIHAVGDNGTSFGLFQLHDAARKSAFQKLYGHDISQASAAEQLDFAFIEMQAIAKAKGVDLTKTVGPHFAGSFVTRNFENPANGAAIAEARGNATANLLNGVPEVSRVPSSVSSAGSTSSTSNDNSRVTHIGTINLQNPFGSTAVTPSMARGMDWNTFITQQNSGLQ